MWNNPFFEPVEGVQNRVFYSGLLGDWVGVNVFLPEGYRSGSERYPAIYWLHDSGGDERSGLFLAPFLRAALAQENIPPLIMVFPNCGEAACNSGRARDDGRAERYLVEELLPYVDANYRTIAGREGRAIEGLGSGGTAAMRLALGRPELFSSASAFGARPATKGGWISGIRARLDRSKLAKAAEAGIAVPRLRIVAPDREPRVLRYSEELRDSIAQRGIMLDYERLEGLGPDGRTYYEATGHAAFNFHFRSLATKPYSYEERRGPYGETRCRNIEFAAPGGRSLALDLYLPSGRSRPFPVVAYIFGGAFRVGSKNDCMACRLVAEGYAVASISYRLSGEAAFPAQLADCKAAIRWLRAHADSYGLDPDRIGAWGMSAGAYLAVMLGVTGGEVGLDLNGSNEGYSSAVQAVCDFYGPTDFLRMDSFIGSFSHDAPQSAESRLLRGPIQAHRELAERASPLRYIHEGAKLPPFLVIHDPRDMYVPFNQSELLVAALRRVGAEVSLVEARELEYPYHGFDDSGPARAFIKSSVDAFFARTLKRG